MLTYKEIIAGVLENPDFGIVGGKVQKCRAKKVAIFWLDSDIWRKWGAFENRTVEEGELVIKYVFFVFGFELRSVLANLKEIKKVLGTPKYLKYEQEITHAVMVYTKELAKYEMQ